MQKNQKELKAGDVFTWLTLTGRTLKKKSKEGWNLTMYEAVCKCGVVKGYLKKYLLNGNTKSCGCYKKVAMSEAVSKHHLSKHPLFNVYKKMISRCYNKKDMSYRDYGGRGISICKEWINDIKVFYEWAIANGWQKHLQIDRTNNDGNYCVGNCRFVTKDINNKNTRRNVFLTAFGETKCMSGWLADKRCKVKGNALKERIKTGRWTNEEAITSLPNCRKFEFSQKISTVRLITAFGETKTMKEWSRDKRCKVGYSGLEIRLKKGYSPELAITLKYGTVINKKAVISSAR